MKAEEIKKGTKIEFTENAIGRTSLKKKYAITKGTKATIAAVTRLVVTIKIDNDTVMIDKSELATKAKAV